jgi:hypothetical protein
MLVPSPSLNLFRFVETKNLSNRFAEQTGLDKSIPLRRLGDRSKMLALDPIALRPHLSASLPLSVDECAGFSFRTNDTLVL